MLTDEDFLRAIRADPADEAPWLMYADWLTERGDPWADVYRTRRFTNSIGMEFVLLPPGTFLMGSPDDELYRTRDEGPQHEVAITRPFGLAVYPVTQRQCQIVMGWHRSYFSRRGGGKEQVEGLDTSDFPVESVSWEEAMTFCRALSGRAAEQGAGRLYRLPTEAEWEYACRGGAQEYQVFYGGDALSSVQANCNGNYPHGGAAKGPYLERTSRVGTYEPNGFGLYDLHGNVFEWCADQYDAHFYAGSPRKDPAGPSEICTRVIRGGSWRGGSQFCRSAYRGRAWSEDRSSTVGFRVASVPSNWQGPGTAAWGGGRG